jgi:EAL domain-containing protein (putative c-di-GMP-specific phosphodiesterase class I)
VRRGDHQLTHFEALLRWQHPRRGLMSAQDFILLAEKTGLILAIGEWVLTTVCQQIKTWQVAGIPIVPIAVNMSGEQFKKQTVYSLVDKTLRETQVDANNVELEVTESAFVQQTEILLKDIEALKKINIKLTIDDFGTYYSSFLYLQRFAADKIKIEKTFVKDIIERQDARDLIAALIVLAHSLKLRIIAEGVETKEQVAYLEEMGIDELQGHFFSKALSVEDTTQYLLKHTSRS